MHWLNAVAMFIMIGSGWKIYNDEVIFGWLHFPEALMIGQWAQHGLQWHFLGMWIVGDQRGSSISPMGSGHRAFPAEIVADLLASELIATIGDAMRLRLAHDDPTSYNTVQKMLYLGVMLVGVLTVLRVWCFGSPFSFPKLATCSAVSRPSRLIHFLCMCAIVVFVVVHVSLALLVPHTSGRDGDRRPTVGR